MVFPTGPGLVTESQSLHIYFYNSYNMYSSHIFTKDTEIIDVRNNNLFIFSLFSHAKDLHKFPQEVQ